MGEMRDSDWSRENLLHSDWLLLIGAIMTTDILKRKNTFLGYKIKKVQKVEKLTYFQRG